MLARICEGRASPFVFSCCDSMGVDVGTCTLDVVVWRNRTGLDHSSKWAFLGVSISLFDLVVGEPGALGRSSPGLLLDFPSTSSAVT